MGLIDEENNGTNEQSSGLNEEIRPWRTDQLILLRQAAAEIASIIDMDKLFDNIVHLINEKFGFSHVGLFTLDEEQGGLKMRAKAGIYKESFPQEHQLNLNQGIVGWVYTNGKSVLSNNVEKDERYVNLLREQVKTSSELAVPIWSGEIVIGVLDVQSLNPDAFDETDEMVLETLADQIAIAWQRADLFEKVAKELSERIKAEGDVRLTNDELKKSNAELKRSNAELAQFAYVASHDLKEPLRMITSYLQLLEKRYGDKLDDEDKDFIRFPVEGARRMQSLIDDLLAYSQVGKQERPFEPVDCNLVLISVLKDLEVAIKEGGVSLKCDRKLLPTIMADQTQIRQVLQNLIGNAIKFRNKKRPEIHVGAKENEDKDKWIFYVSDNGIGIDPQYHERIFNVFQRLHKREEYSGNGIGLSICKKTVERHGGGIWLDSKPGKGTTFYFSIPKSSSESV